MKNTLKKFEDGPTEFFVSKSFVSAIFETERKKSEYHIFYIKQNSNPEAYCQGYLNLKSRRMNRKEVEYFKRNIDNYTETMKNDDGTVFNLKTKLFDKSQCPTHKQYALIL
jgi:hypothetical protein